ncbi:MAG: hypothetical protein CMH30_04555 [Micavibrio sp.]|jgi:hypothetical protein|nr:hypothetical protein [Micavibrio sp.]|tara:strand:- start:3219 stop:3458 length:240 start_codon:yes stop_codon:yes gene_type:complete
MTGFTLDETKKFSENCTIFLESVKDIDPEMTKILEANWDKLLAVVRAGERDTKARTTFNEAILTALNLHLAEKLETEIE